MRNVKQMSKQEEIRVYYERRQVGKTEKVEKKTETNAIERQKNIKYETNEEKSLIGINRGHAFKKQEKREARQFPHQRQLVVESIIDLEKIREIISEKCYYQEYNETIWFNVYKQYDGLKRKPKKIKSLQLYEGFQPQYEQERADKGRKQKEKLFQNVHEISKGRENHIISLALSKTMMSIFYMTNIPW